MSHFVSVLSAVGTGAAAPAGNFTARARGAEAAPAFSSALERAVQRSPERKRESAFDRSGRHQPTQSEAAESAARNERRGFSRVKNNNNPRDEEQSLAGAGAVNGQAAKLETPTQWSLVASGGPAEPTLKVAGELAGETPAAADDAMPSSAALAGETEAEGAAPVMKNASTPADELEILLQPMSAAELAAAEGELELPLAAKNPASSPGAVEQSPAKVASAIASALGTEEIALTPDEMVLDGLNPAPSAEVAEAVAPTSDAARRAARAVRRSLEEARETARGTAGAISTETMKTAMNQEKFAGLGEPGLPNAAALPVSTLSNLPGEARLGAPGGGAAADVLAAAGKLTPAPTRADVSGAGDLLDLRPPSPLVRVNELVAREVRMFKRGGDDLVEVVLTPDTKTQISLRLQWREGQVEVQARCDLGDHQSLSQQWPQLQNAMAQHGVRLSHLNERTPTGFTEFFNHPSFSQQHGGERRPAGAGAPGEGPSARGEGRGTPAAAPPAAARSQRLFDSWA